ncbi:hypothetical protein [uncultured Roseobacter sp.]|uniref:hypothetical protein n=1 Tax=uncultured Roseobacter sp. TaxID=114847 RepID=UPI0026195FD3|nr:hypothetical protein [uncultured Roseobacter sp.]
MDDLEVRMIRLQKQVEKADATERLRLQPQVARVVATMTSRGRAVPAHMRRINHTLMEEAQDDMFDNMPV